MRRPPGRRPRHPRRIGPHAAGELAVVPVEVPATSAPVRPGRRSRPYWCVAVGPPALAGWPIRPDRLPRRANAAAPPPSITCGAFHHRAGRLDRRGEAPQRRHGDARASAPPKLASIRTCWRWAMCPARRRRGPSLQRGDRFGHHVAAEAAARRSRPASIRPRMCAIRVVMRPPSRPRRRITRLKHLFATTDSAFPAPKPSDSVAPKRKTETRIGALSKVVGDRRPWCWRSRAPGRPGFAVVSVKAVG